MNQFLTRNPTFHCVNEIIFDIPQSVYQHLHSSASVQFLELQVWPSNRQPKSKIIYLFFYVVVGNFQLSNYTMSIDYGTL